MTRKLRLFYCDKMCMTKKDNKRKACADAPYFGSKKGCAIIAKFLKKDFTGSS